MDIANLQAFIAVADQRSFSKAAQVLHLTQPAISKRVSTLEQQLGSKLFDRINRNLVLTEAGEALLPRSRRILHEIEDSLRDIQNLSGSAIGRLRLGTSHHIGLHHLPPILKQYASQYPEVDLDLRFMDSEQAYNAVTQGELEFAIVTLPPHTSEKVVTVPLWEDPLSLFVSPSHPLAREPELTLQTLTNYPAILPATGTYTRQLVDHYFNQEDRKLTIKLSSNYLETIKMMVSVNLGWSILPDSMKDDSVQAVKLTGMNISRTLGLVYHRERAITNAGKRMLEMLESFSQG